MYALQVGDSLVFTYGAGYHDVQIVDNTNCDFSSGTVVDTSGAYTYTVAAADAGTSIIFACSHSSHCANGQQVTVNVAAAAGRYASLPTNISTHRRLQTGR